MQNRGAEMLRLSIFGRFRAADALGNEIPIKSKKARALLAYLALPPGKERSREEVMALLWSERGDEQARSSLRQALSGLRKELGEMAVGALRVTDEWLALDPRLVAVEPAPPGDVLLAGLHISDPAFDEWLRDERLRHEDATVSTSQSPVLPVPDRPSIAVLPFTNMTGDPEQEYFSDGVTAEITTQLARFRDLFVISQNSAFLYKNSAASSQKAGQDLGVAYILEGSIQKAGNRVRIAAKLLDAATSVQLWAERYDRELSDIFAVQDEVTARIVSALAGQIEESGRKRAEQKSTENLAAYDFFLRGEHHLAQGSMADVLEARRMFERAIELDPHHAKSWAGLALSYMEEYWSGWTKAPEAAAERSLELAQKAVAVDERDSRAHLVLSEAYLYARGDFDRALIEIEKATELNPNDYTNFCFQSWLHALNGKTSEGIVCANTAFRLNPYAAYDCRIGQFLACFAASAYKDALTALQSISSAGGIAQACLAACYAKLDRSEEARRAMNSFIEEARSEFKCFPGEDAAAWREYWRKWFPFRTASVCDDLISGMRDAGLPV
jgi:TolB-like protein/Flp pilus assembly protein TadD